MNASELETLTRLCFIKEIATYVMGTESGKMVALTQDAVDGMECRIKQPILAQRGWHVVRIPLPVENPACPPDLDDLFPCESIELVRVILRGKYELICGYGPRSKTWAVAEGK
jgi:hypothetical protein